MENTFDVILTIEITNDECEIRLKSSTKTKMNYIPKQGTFIKSKFFVNLPFGLTNDTLLVKEIVNHYNDDLSEIDFIKILCVNF